MSLRPQQKNRKGVYLITQIIQIPNDYLISIALLYCIPYMVLYGFTCQKASTVHPWLAALTFSY